MADDLEGDPCTLPELLALLGGELAPTETVRKWTPCLVCGAGAEAIRPGVPTVCAICSTAELGETWPGLAHRVSHHMTLAQWNKLETVEDIPSLRYKVWRKRQSGL